jgi:hypothetical protein
VKQGKKRKLVIEYVDQVNKIAKEMGCASAFICNCGFKTASMAELNGHMVMVHDVPREKINQVLDKVIEGLKNYERQ